MRKTVENGGLICMHAENGSIIDVIVKKAVAEGKKAPIYHALTRPTTAEAEAVNRAIAFAEIAGVPVYIVHLSSNDALLRVAEARDKGVLAYAETCPQYLFLSLDDMDRPNFERRNSSSHLLCAKNGIRINCGKDSRRTICKSFRPIIVRFVLKNKKNWEKTTSQKFRTADPASKIASSFCMTAA